MYIFDKILIDCDLYSAEEKQSCTDLDCPINNVIRKVSVLRLHDKHVADIQEAANINVQILIQALTRHSDCHRLRDGYRYEDTLLKTALDGLSTTTIRSGVRSRKSRDIFADYFMKEGRLPWQDKMIFLSLFKQ